MGDFIIIICFTAAFIIILYKFDKLPERLSDLLDRILSSAAHSVPRNMDDSVYRNLDENYLLRAVLSTLPADNPLNDDDMQRIGIAYYGVFEDIPTRLSIRSAYLEESERSIYHEFHKRGNALNHRDACLLIRSMAIVSVQSDGYSHSRRKYIQRSAGQIGLSTKEVSIILGEIWESYDRICAAMSTRSWLQTI